MSSVSFTVLAHDLASRVFRGVGNAAMAMAAKVRAADAAAGNVGGVTRNVAMQAALQQAYARSAVAAGRLNRAMHFMTGGTMTPHARLWFRVILGGLLMMPAVIGPAVVAFGALAGAIVSVTPGALALGAAMVGVFGRIKEVANGADTASPSLQRAADALNRVKEAWSGFLDGTQGSVANIFTQAFGGLADLLPRLVPMTRTFADVFTKFLRDVRRDMRGPEFADALKWLERVGSQTFGNILSAGRNLIEFFYQLGRAFDSAGIDVTAKWLDNLTASWAKWAESLRNSQGFRDFVDWIKEQWPKITTIAKNLGETLGNMFEGFKPISSDALTGLVHLTEAMSKISPQQWEAIGRAFITLAVGSKALGLALALVTPGKVAGLMSLGRLAATPWGAVAAGILAVAGALATLYVKVPETRGFFHVFIDEWAVFAVRMSQFAQQIPQMFGRLVAGVTQGYASLRGALAKGVALIANPGGSLAQAFSTMSTRVISVMTTLSSRVGSIAASIATRLGTSFNGAASRVASATGRIASQAASMAARVAGATARVASQAAAMAGRVVSAATRAVSGFTRIATQAASMAGRVAGATARVASQAASMAARVASAAARVVSQFTRVASQSGSMAARVASAAARVVSQLTRIASQSGSMAGRVASAASRAVSSFSRIAAQAASAAGRAVSSFSRIASGANSMAGRVGSAAANMASRLSGAASRAAGVASSIVGSFARIGSAASNAAGRVSGLISMMNGLRSKTVTLTTNIVTTTTNIIRDIFRAKGGPVRAGEPYIVGEVGPELFVPGQSGTIIPNNRLGGGTAGQGSMNAAAVAQLLERVTALLAEMSALRESVEALPKRQMQLARQGGR